VSTDKAAAYLRVLDEIVPDAQHLTERYANNPIEARSRPAEGSAAPDARTETAPLGGVIAAGHAFVQNLRRGHYELAIDIPAPLRLAEAFTELALAV